jgi:urease accessory protein
MGRAEWHAPDAQPGLAVDPPVVQRARGKLYVGLCRGEDGATRVVDLFQQGCLKVRLPRPENVGEADLVVMNTAGGLTGGDRVSIEVAAAAGARVTVTTPGCERIYRSAQGEAVIEQRLRVGPGARLDWIPQETILYDRSRVRRRLEAHLEDDAEITIVETILFGRAAMGERLIHGAFSDFWTIHRDGRLIFADGTRIGEGFEQTMANPATLGGEVALASLVHVGPDLAGKRDALRAGFAGGADVRAGASVVGDVLVARMVAPGGSGLRHALVAALGSLRHPRATPRLWFF